MIIDNFKKQIRKQRTVFYEMIAPIGKRRLLCVHHHKSPLTIIKTNKPSNITPSWRHEMKYIVNESTALAVTNFVKMYLKMDRYSKIQPTGFYPIVSLYLDSKNFELFRGSLDGHKNRFKLRVRSYSDDEDTPCFFEIKRRMDKVIIKSRTRIKKETAPLLLAGQYPKISHNYTTDEKVLRQFQLYTQSIQASPVVRIRYLRQAFESDNDNRVRVTFDKQLCCNTDNIPTMSLNGSGWQELPTGGIVLEIKFTGQYPLWLKQMAEYFNLRQIPVSKYARAIERACSLKFCAPKVPI